jgi:hypothetical protein
MANDPSAFEYTQKDTAHVAISKSGARFPFSNRVASSSYNPNESSSVVKGSGKFPVAHTGKTAEPGLTLTMPIDERDRFEKWFGINCKDDEICDVERRRKKPRTKAVTDSFGDWLPIFGEESFVEGDATMVEVSGNLLNPRKDVTNALTP